MYFFLRITTVLNTTTLKHQIPHLFAVLRCKYIKSDISITGLEISGCPGARGIRDFAPGTEIFEARCPAGTSQKRLGLNPDIYPGTMISGRTPTFFNLGARQTPAKKRLSSSPGIRAGQPALAGWKSSGPARNWVLPARRAGRNFEGIISIWSEAKLSNVSDLLQNVWFLGDRSETHSTQTVS